MKRKRAARNSGKQKMGRIALVLLPSVKMKAKGPSGQSHDEELHDFLMDNFHGYTVTAGSISGYWKDSSGHEHYGEHREYKVALSNLKKLPRLEKYFSDLGTGLGEKWIYWQVGEEGWLIGPCGGDR